MINKPHSLYTNMTVIFICIYHNSDDKIFSDTSQATQSLQALSICENTAIIIIINLTMYNNNNNRSLHGFWISFGIKVQLCTSNSA